MALIIFYLSLINSFLTNYTQFTGIVKVDSQFYLSSIGGLIKVNNNFNLEKYYSYFDGLSSNYLTDLSTDRDTNLWIGSQYGGLIYFDRKNKKFQTYPKEKIPSEININRIIIEKDTIFLATNYGLYVILTKGTFANFEDDSVFKIEYPKIPTNNIFCLLVADDIWLGTNRGVSKIKKDFKTVNNYLKPLGESVKAIIKVKDTLFFLTELGIAYFKDERFYPFFYETLKIVYDFCFYKNNFYLATNSGLFKIIANNQKLDTLLNDKTVRLYPTLKKDTLFALAYGWAPTTIGYLFLLSDTTPQKIWFPTIFSQIISDAVLDGNGNLYLAHFMVYPGVNIISLIKPDNSIIFLSDTLINSRSLAIDQKNRLWIGHWAINGGVSCYLPEENRFQIYQWGERSLKNVIGGISIDYYDTKWIRNGENIIALDSLGNYYEFNILNLGRLEELAITRFAFDKKNRVYLGTSNGLLMIDHKNTLNNFNDDEIKIITDGLLSPIINACCCDRKGRIWVATPNGAGFLKDDFTFEIFTTQNSGLLANEVYFVDCDKYNRIWFLTKEGISLYYPEKKKWKTFNQYFLPNWEKRSNFYRSFTINDYFGEVLIATENGLIRFPYPEEPFVPFEPKIYPNPIVKDKNDVYLKVSNLPPNAKLKIYNFLGKLMATDKDFKKDNSDFLIKIDQKFKGGLYFLTIETETEKFVEKFIVVE